MYSLETHPEFLDEILFSASRSGGPGGQNVNKVSTKVELRFHVLNSKVLLEEHKELVIKKATNKINNEGYLILTSQEERSQLKNKLNVQEKFFNLLNMSIIKRKKRRITKPSFAAKQERLEKKKGHSNKKALRKYKPDY